MKQKPLAYRMRPAHINEIIGQTHLVGDGKIVNRMMHAERLSSMILFDPPGTGKTSMAIALAKSLEMPVKMREAVTDKNTEMEIRLDKSLEMSVKMLNAVADKKKDMEIVVEEAKMMGQVVLVLDEVHRLDKAKQDFLLPHIENNLVTLIGCTTSNPYHSINPAI